MQQLGQRALVDAGFPHCFHKRRIPDPTAFSKIQLDRPRPSFVLARRPVEILFGSRRPLQVARAIVRLDAVDVINRMLGRRWWSQECSGDQSVDSDAISHQRISAARARIERSIRFHAPTASPVGNPDSIYCSPLLINVCLPAHGRSRSSSSSTRPATTGVRELAPCLRAQAHALTQAPFARRHGADLLRAEPDREDLSWVVFAHQRGANRLGGRRAGRGAHRLTKQQQDHSQHTCRHRRPSDHTSDKLGQSKGAV